MVPRVSGLGRFHCTHNAYSTLEEVKEEVTTMLATLATTWVPVYSGINYSTLP